MMSDWKPDICIYHGGCDDGFGAAWAVWRKWPDIEFVPGYHGKPIFSARTQFAGKHLLFVDFSLKREAMAALVSGDLEGANAASIVVIDHHKTAEAELEPFIHAPALGISLSEIDVPACFGKLGELERLPILAFFDMQSSGAVMAWDFCHGIPRNDPPPTMLSLIQDRDLWKFTYGDRTRQFSAALRTYPMDFETWDRIANDPDALVAEGALVLRAHRANIDKFMLDAFTETIGGHEVPCCNVPYHYASDTAHELLRRYPNAAFTASWFKRSDGLRQFSLRSEDRRLDVSEIAKALGGGGHRNAAGFQIA